MGENPQNPCIKECKMQHKAQYQGRKPQAVVQIG